MLPLLFPFAGKAVSADAVLDPPTDAILSPVVPPDPESRTSLPASFGYTPGIVLEDDWQTPRLLVQDNQTPVMETFGVPPSGNLEDRARIDEYTEEIESPEELARLKSQSAVEHLRLQLQQWGLAETPLNNIIQLDGWWFKHDDKVRAVINSPEDGLVPRAHVRFWDAQGAPPPATDFFTPETHEIPKDNRVVRKLTESLYEYADWLKFLMAYKEAENVDHPLVVNMSIGILLAEYYDKGPDSRRQKRVDFVDEQVHRPEVQQALAYWVESTRQAVDAGIFPVIAIGNEHSELPEGIQSSVPDWQVNMLGWSPYVFRVAAARENGTPGNYADDTATPYSSWGSRWKPTMTISGESVPLASMNEQVTGTSYIDPVATVLLALQLHHNPNLTFSDLEDLSREASQPVNAPESAVGPGVLVPERFLATILAE